MVRADVQLASARSHCRLTLVRSVELSLAQPPGRPGSMWRVCARPARLRPALDLAHCGSSRCAAREFLVVERAPAARRTDRVAAPGSPSLGLAIDLEPPTWPLSLIDLQSGQRLASLAIENPQVAWART